MTDILHIEDENLSLYIEKINPIKYDNNEEECHICMNVNDIIKCHVCNKKLCNDDVKDIYRFLKNNKIDFIDD
jgi:hypothetical protein